jgi:tryptophanase
VSNDQSTHPEPFKIKMVEKIELLPSERRKELAKKNGYNVFMLRAEDVFIDLLTDSGTSAMSDQQWAGMVKTTQSYAGSQSYYSLEKAMRDIFGFKHVIPVHQGRAAENILFSTMLFPGCYVPNNMHFDTTEANVLRNEGQPVNLAVDEAYDTTKPAPFKGNMNTKKLDQFIIEKTARKIPLIMTTVTNNTAGGQPVSIQNVKETSAIAKKHRIPFFIDACRFAENCYFIKQREQGYQDHTIKEIANELFSYADGCTFSGKKEALTNIGGLLCANDNDLYEKLRNLCIVIEGYPTYGGMACRELEAMAIGLYEAVDEEYQAYRHRQIEYLASLLRKEGVPIVEPAGGHAVFVDAKKFLPHILPEQFPAQALTVQIYIESGVRAVEIGSSCFGKTDEKTGKFVPAEMELVRLAIPRRTYTDNHLKYVAESISRLHRSSKNIKGLKRVYAPKLLGHFTAKFEPLN